MKKLAFLLLAAQLSVFAKSSLEIAQQLVDDPSKASKLAVLFSDQDNSPNIKQISQLLKMNGLLNYSYPNSVHQQLVFKANAHASIMLKAITSAFEQIGVSYYLPSAYNKQSNEISIGFMINSKTLIDPGALWTAFLSMGIKMTDATRHKSDFEYQLDFSKAHILAAISLGVNDNIELKKPLDDYFVQANNLNKLSVLANISDIWYPKILFLDKNLNLISAFINDKRFKQLDIDVPLNTNFIIIGDKFSLENIKHGLKIIGG